MDSANSGSVFNRFCL